MRARLQLQGLPRTPGAILLLGLLLAGCGATSGAPGAAGGAPTATATAGAIATTTAATPAVIKVGIATVGGAMRTILTDASGKPLYYFDSDTSTSVACTGSCAQNWPPLLLPSGDTASASPLSGALTTLSGANGRQVLYNGHPLYGFAGDDTPGIVHGDGLGGHRWHVATPDTAPATASPTGTPGYGY
jgi:predicted lipoprotein with Yx(FWY)xxD motif